MKRQITLFSEHSNAIWKLFITINILCSATSVLSNIFKIKTMQNPALISCSSCPFQVTFLCTNQFQNTSTCRRSNPLKIILLRKIMYRDRSFMLYGGCGRRREEGGGGSISVQWVCSGIIIQALFWMCIKHACNFMVEGSYSQSCVTTRWCSDSPATT